jgi:hypothetical protein
LFKRLPDVKVSGQDALVFEVDSNSGVNPKQQRVIIKKNGYFYVLQKDYQTTQDLPEFYNFLSTFKFTQ